MQRVALPFLIGLGAILLAAQACGGDDAAGAAGGGGRTGKLVPEPTGSATTSTEERTYAINTIALGEATRAGATDPNAWKTLGYNLDGLITTATAKDSPDLKKVCKLADKASATVHQDGDQGIDNTFAKEVLPLIRPFQQTPSKTITENVTKGGFTILFKLKGLTDDPAQTNTGLSGTLLIGSAFDQVEKDETKMKKPTFTTADDWPYNKEPQVALSDAFIKDGFFYNGSGAATVELTLSVSGQPLTLKINRAIISFKHAAGDSLEEGTIAGVINTEEFVTGITSVAGGFSKDLCNGTTIEGIKGEIREASDMIADGSQDPSKTCDGISIGIGFTAKRVGNPTQPVDRAPATPICP